MLRCRIGVPQMDRFNFVEALIRQRDVFALNIFFKLIHRRCADNVACCEPTLIDERERGVCDAHDVFVCEGDVDL